MAPKVITFAIQKGGAGKTTTAGMAAYMLSQSSPVLVVDMDSQGNITELLTQTDLDMFREHTVLEAMKAQDVRPYIRGITDNLHIVPADNFLALFTREVYSGAFPRQTNPSALLEQSLKPVYDRYEYIIIDTPPALGTETINALTASTDVVALFETSKYSFTALQNFLGTVAEVQDNTNPNVKIAGILRSIVDSRRKDAKALVDLVQESYGTDFYVFKSVITRTAHVGRLNIEGFHGNPELAKCVNDYQEFLEELITRVNSEA